MGTPAASSTIPSSATPSPSEVRTRYFQAASERSRLAAEADEDGRSGGRRLDEEPGGAEVAGQRNGEQDRPERVEDGVGAVAIPAWTSDPGVSRRAGRRARWRVRRGSSPTRSPPAASTTIQSPPGALRIGERLDRQRQPDARPGPRKRAPAVHEPVRRERSSTAASAGPPTTTSASSAANHGASSGRPCRPPRTRRRCVRGTPPRPAPRA